MDSYEVFAPKPIRKSSRPSYINYSPKNLEIDIPSVRKSNSEMSSPSSVTSSTSSLQSSQISFSNTEAGIENNQFAEEITKILNNELAWDNFKRSSFNVPQFIKRPKNSFYQSLENDEKI